MKHSVIKILLLGLLVISLIAACASLPVDLPWVIKEELTATPPPEQEGTPVPTPEKVPEVEDIPAIISLTVWVPPEMDPNSNTAASELFAARLRAFSEVHNEIEIVVRVKAASGTGGLLDTLTASAAVATSALPDLIALTRPDLETAALKGLIHPLEGMTKYPDDPDWYSFAREMALIQGSTFGLPFAADALSLVYRPNKIRHSPGSWAELFDENKGLVLAFPADQDQALFLMNLYLAEGGSLQDYQRKPLFEEKPLVRVFELLEEGVNAGAFPDWISQYQTFTQVWDAFQGGQVDFAVTWISNVLQKQPDEAVAAPLFAGSEELIALGTGMSWALASQDEHRHPLAVELAEFLVEPLYLVEWTQAAGYIPTRPSSLEGWQNQSIRTTISQIALMTRLRPPHDVTLSLGPALRDGGRQILQSLSIPENAAQFAIESLGDF